MYVIKCPKCQSSKVKKNGKKNGSQMYKCRDCGHQFSNTKRTSSDTLFDEYVESKQTIKEIARRYKISPATVWRSIHKQALEWEQPDLWGFAGYVHLDTTYWGHNWGVLLALDDATGMILYMAFVKTETTLAYKIAIEEIIIAGYHIRGIIIDGKQELFDVFHQYPVQMCQFHILQILKRKLTKNPKLHAARELLGIAETMIILDEEDFMRDYIYWKNQWRDFLNRRTIHKDGKSYYLHRRLRGAVNSLEFYLPYLFTFQRPECEGMPNTNNKIEGTFTDLKKNLNNHSGLCIEHRKQFIIAYLQNRIRMVAKQQILGFA